ncbi:response regulator [Clostridiaceae bacterium HSG29]|nr:response regulator [Clostridiaceae bacterium HSG29]
MNGIDYKKYSVLFVDDEIPVLKAIKRGLHLEKYNKFFASSGEEALQIMKENEISLIVSDMKMPKMDGIQLLKKVNSIKPEIYKIILSGYTSTAQIIASINLTDIDRFILKPNKTLIRVDFPAPFSPSRA